MSIFRILQTMQDRAYRRQHRDINREESLLACVIFLGLVMVVAFAWKCI